MRQAHGSVGRSFVERRLVLIVALVFVCSVALGQTNQGNFQTPINVTNVNSSSDDREPSVASDGQELYLSSNRGGGKGQFDVYIAAKAPDNTFPQAWQSAINLVTHNENIFPAYAAANPDDDLVDQPSDTPEEAAERTARRNTLIYGVNSGANEISPCISADGTVLLYASDSSQADVTGVAPQGGFDLYVLVRNARNEPWRGPFNCTALNSSADERDPEITPDNEWLFFASNRQDGNNLGGFDIYRAQRDYPANTQNLRPEERFREWKNVEHIPVICTPVNDLGPGWNDEDGIVYFTSDRPGGVKTDYDIWESPGAPDDPSSFDLPTKVGAPVSSEGATQLSEKHPDIQIGSVIMFFQIDNKDGGLGGSDVWVSSTSSQAIPTLSEWGMIVFVGLLAIALGVMVSRRERGLGTVTA